MLSAPPSYQKADPAHELRLAPRLLPRSWFSDLRHWLSIAPDLRRQGLVLLLQRSWQLGYVLPAPISPPELFFACGALERDFDPELHARVASRPVIAITSSPPKLARPGGT